MTTTISIHGGSALDLDRCRLARHIEFVREQAAEGKPLKYTNSFHGFPVKTSQEQRLLISEVISIDETTEGLFTVSYRDEPLGTTQADMRDE